MENMEFKKENLSISEAVLGVAQKNPNRIAITYMGRKISYKKLTENVNKLSLALYSLGVRKGDAVLVVLPNIPQAVYVLYGLNRIGGIPLFVSPLSAQAELEYFINKCRCSFVIALDIVYEKLLKVFEKTGDRTLIITSPFDEWGFTFKSKKPKAVLWRDLFSRKNSNIYISPQKADDTAVILFSGGTTGKPKAVELTNLNLNALAQGTEEACGYNVTGVKMLSTLPVFHGFGLGICIHTVLYFGGECILVPRFDADKTGRIIKKAKPHFIAVVPAMLSPLINSKPLAKADLSALKGVFSGGDSLKSDLEEEFNKFLLKHNSSIKIRQGYGLTECVASSCLMPADIIKRESIGKPYPDTLYKIVRQNTMEEVPLGEKGEICISGKTVMKGYFCDEEETRNALKTHPDGKLWLHTGDIGFMDKDGFVYFTGRIKRIIVTNGYNVYPSEIEKALLKHKEVKDCCVVGVNDKRKAQVGAAFAVLKRQANESAETKAELLNHLDGFVSKQSKPKFIFFIRSIPKTALGKTDYTELVRIAEKSIGNK